MLLLTNRTRGELVEMKIFEFKRVFVEGKGLEW